MPDSFQVISNPFSTRFTRPNAMPFLLSPEQELESILEAFRAGGHRGQIMGPHGCGKTTMTYALQRRLQNEFPSVRRITIRNSRTVETIEHVAAESDPQLLVIDGLERVPAIQRWLLTRTCRRQGKGLLVTTHKRLRHLPVICFLQPRPAMFLKIVEHLEPGAGFQEEFLERIFVQAGGNIREALMQLYDRFEANRKQVAERKNSSGVATVAR